MWFSKMIILDGVTRDRAEQLGEIGEYWMGRLRVVWIVNLEFQGGSPRLCWLRPVSIGSEWISNWNVLTHTRHMESPNWVAFCIDELDDTLSCFTGVQWDSVRATHGVSAKAYAFKTALGRGRTQPCFLVTSWIVATRGALWACVCHVVGFIPLQGWLLIRISVTPSDMGDGFFAASICRIVNYIIIMWW
jgi:hypothetical protein